MSNATQYKSNSQVKWKVPPEKRIGLLDADGILYAAAAKGQVDLDGEIVQLLDDEAIYQDALSRAAHWASWLGDEVGQLFLVLSARDNFRYRILPTYKGNRKGSDRPIALDRLRARFLEEEGSHPGGFTVMLIDGLEADDVCGIASTTFQERGYEAVIISPDKDLLTIPGMVLTPKARGVVFSELTPERAAGYHLYQTMVGDTTDNYKGIPGVGPKKAAELLDTFEDPKERWEAMVALAAEKGLTEEDLLVQARVARILRNVDWDATLKAPILWDPTKQENGE